MTAELGQRWVDQRPGPTNAWQWGSQYCWRL